MGDFDLLMTTIVELYHEIHTQVRQEIADLTPDELNWMPGPGTNSIGTLVVHLLGTEEEVLHSVHGVRSDRDRDAEFVPRAYTAAELLDLIQRADSRIAALAREINAADLHTPRTRPHRPIAATGMFWLLRNYGHSREHLAHLQLTKQFYGFTHPA